MDTKACALLTRYRGIDNLLKASEYTNIDKKMIFYCVLQYLLALKQYIANIELRKAIMVIKNKYLQTKEFYRSKKRYEAEQRRLHEEKLKASLEQVN